VRAVLAAAFPARLALRAGFSKSVVMPGMGALLKLF
jgi:hypothetical protein